MRSRTATAGQVLQGTTTVKTNLANFDIRFFRKSMLPAKDPATSEEIKKRLIDVMTEGRASKSLSDQFQWKLHGV